MALVLLFCGGLGMLTADNHKKWSEMEWRNYTQFPQLDWKSLFDMKYLKQLETAFTDQIQYREQFVHQYYSLMHSCGLSYLKHVVGKEDQLFGVPLIPDDLEKRKSELIAAAELVNEEAAKIAALGKTFIYIHFPRKDTVMEEYLPWYYPISHEAEEIALFREHLSDDVVFINAYELFLQNQEEGPFYYQTDHHANFDGAMLVYHDLIKIVSNHYPAIPKYTKADYTLALRRMDGTYNRTIGRIIIPDEEPLNVVSSPSLSYQRWDMDKESDQPIFGDQNTYSSAYMGGDFGHTLIKTTQNDGPSFLISGLSFTNILEALVLPVCRSMESLDYRYLNVEETLYDYAAACDAEYVVFVPSTSTVSIGLSYIRQQLGLAVK